MTSPSNSQAPGDDVPLRCDDSEVNDHGEKLAKLQKYIPFLSSTIARLEISKDKVRASQLSKLKNLFQILTTPNRTMKADILDKCEGVLKKLEEKLKFPIPADNLELSKIIKTEPDEVKESPASPPQSDLSSPKSTPKIIPVERCATVERDFSKVVESAPKVTTLEKDSLDASRYRLQGLLRREQKQVNPELQRPQIPGLDVRCPREESSGYNSLPQSSNIHLTSEIEVRNESQSGLRLFREEWNHPESASKSRAVPVPESNWVSHRGDVDERNMNRDQDYREARRDVDDRVLPGSEGHGRQVHSLANHPPFVPPAVGHMMHPSSLHLPRHVPTHNIGFSSYSSQEFHRTTESVHVDVTSHQVVSKTFTSTTIMNNAPMQPKPPPDLVERSFNHSQYLARPNIAPLLPTPRVPPLKTSLSSSSIDERRTTLPHHQSALQGESCKSSARERLMQGMDEVKKLGVSSGGALRKLKSDFIDIGKRRHGETDSMGMEDAPQRLVDIVPRNIDPRLERDHRRNLADDDAQKIRIGCQNNELPPPHNMSSFSGQNTLASSAQWSQSHITPTVGRPIYQGQHSVMRQTTGTMKQTTAHDLGLRYQSKSRQSRPMHGPHNERNMHPAPLKPVDELKEPENQNKECDNAQISGRRLSDPQQSSSKIVEDKKYFDSRIPDAFRKKEKHKDKKDDYSSPLNSLYNEDKCSKTGQGYGFQNYKIPRRPKEPSPPKEPNQYAKQAVVNIRVSTNRDPRLSKIASSPNTARESNMFASSVVLNQDTASEGNASGSTFTEESKKISDCQGSSKSHSSCLPRDAELDTIKSVGPSSSNTHLLKSQSHSKVTADESSLSPFKARASSPMDHRGNLEGRSRSRSVDRGSPHLRDKSKEKSPTRYKSEGSSASISNTGRSRSSGRLRMRSRSTSRSEERERSASPSRRKSIGRSTYRSSRKRSVSRSRATSRTRSPSPSRSRARSTSRSRAKSRVRRKTKSPSRPRSRGRSTSRSRDSSKTRRKSRVRSVSRSRAQSRGRGLSRSRSKTRSTSRNRGRSSSRCRVRNRSRERSSSSYRARSPHRSPSYTRDAEGSSTRRSLSRSLSRGRSPSYFHSKTIERHGHTSRACSQSSDSDRHSVLDSWKRKQSPSPDRERFFRKGCSRSRKRSISSDSNISINSSSVQPNAAAKTKSQVKSTSVDNYKKQCDSKGRSESRDDVKKSPTSSRSSSSSRRSSPLFPMEKSPLTSSHRQIDFDNLLSKDLRSETQMFNSSVGEKDISSGSPEVDSDFHKDTVVSSSVNISTNGQKTSPVGDAPDVPTSTSESVEATCKTDVGSSSEVSVGDTIHSKQDDAGSGGEAGNIIVGLLKSLASQDNIFKNNSLIELAKLAASQLPEDKRNKVLEIFKEEGEVKKANDEIKRDESAISSAPSTSTAQSSPAPLEPVACSNETSVPTTTSNMKSKQKKETKSKTKVKSKQDVNISENSQEVSPDSPEKQRKKRAKNELEKLHEDIREMFICDDVISATGQRSCRMRNQTQEPIRTTKHRPASADGKLKSLRSKQDDFSEVSDNSPNKEKVLDTSASTSEHQTTESSSNKSGDSFGSDNEVLGSTLARVCVDSPSPVFKRKKKSFAHESESESDSVGVDDEMPRNLCVPMVVLEKVARRNVARRGRKTGTMSRNQRKPQEDALTPLHDGDCDEEQLDQYIEDKDMSQIDTSNIIQVETGRSKLTRNQLKLLKGSEHQQETKSGNKRSLSLGKDCPEWESDTSKVSEPFPSQRRQPEFSSLVKKKRKIKITSGEEMMKTAIQKGKGPMAEESCETLSQMKINAATSLDGISGLIQDKPNTSTLSCTSTGFETNDLHLNARVQGLSHQNHEVESSVAQPSVPNPRFHGDLDYNVSLRSQKVPCKICKFSGRFIVHHYVNCHPKEEVLISRLTKSLSDYAKIKAHNYQGDVQSLIVKYSIKKRSPWLLQCLVCEERFTSSLLLYEHTTVHTGEYRYACTECNYKSASRMTLKGHWKKQHSAVPLKGYCNVFHPEQVASMKVLFAYVCSVCNYFQLNELNIKKHLEVYHPQIPSAHAIRFNMSGELSQQIEASRHIKDKGKDTAKFEQVLKKETGEVAEINELKIAENDMENCMPKLENEVLKTAVIDNMKKIFEKPSLEKQTTFGIQCSDENACPTAASLDMSVFIGSEQPAEDEHQLQEIKRKLLEEVKVFRRSKAHSSVSERLTQRLCPDHAATSLGDVDVCISEDNDASEASATPTFNEMLSTPSRANLRTTPARLLQKSNDVSEKRLTRSTSRTVAAFDSDSQVIPSDVPDLVKEPLPASILHATLQRMQETIQCPVSSSSQASSSDSFFHTECILKKGSVTVGLVEARAQDQTPKALFVCLWPNCSFNTKQIAVFLRHTNEHPRKPGPAPCSICVDGDNILRDMQSSFSHLIKYHLLDTHMEASDSTTVLPAAFPPGSSTQLSRKPLIRPRKLPGDILSQPDCSAASRGSEEASILMPSLVISSVISLSKNHTPDGVPLTSQNQNPCTYHSSSSSKVVTSFKKDEGSMKEMVISFEKLCHLFKCMGQHCSFSTTMKEFFAAHYHKHSLKELQINSNTASKVYEWQKCVYCGESKDSGEDLADHILLRHSVLKYQCSGCFYRAASAESVAFHQRKSHNVNVMVFECQNSGQNISISNATRPQLDKIQLYKCCQGKGYGQCGLVFLSAEKFTSHQLSFHKSDEIFYCTDCGVGFNSPSKLICHFSASHSYRMYHCLHCPKASETQAEISCHMYLDHPDKDMIVAARTKPDDTNYVETVVLSSGHIINLVNFGNCHPPPSVRKDLETDISNDPLYFDEDPSLQCVTFDISASSSWAHKSFSIPSSHLPSNENRLKRPNVENFEGSSRSILTEKDSLLNVNPEQHCKDDNVTGLSGTSLFVCGYSGCSFKAEKSSVLKEHLLHCQLARGVGNLSCVHCGRLFQHSLTLIEHLPKHGVPRFICGLCDKFKTTHPKIALRHVNQKHKTSAVEIVPLNPHDSDPDTALHIVRHKENILKRGKAKPQLSFINKTFYGPDERDQLPKSAVFTRNITCAVCQYSTKVRSNMKRHLEQHALGYEPSSAPVLNPVPCLERSEKMFDTMTNHAISSTTPVRRDSNTYKVTDEPKFVPENQRFVCCAPACLQISSDDTMLRHHIRVLHPEILNYKCPHCPDSESDGGKQSILLEKLGSHLKMHDNRLYSCRCCTYYHYQRHFVERHTEYRHPDEKFIKIVREPQPDGPADVENIVDAESEIVTEDGSYECALCQMKGMSKQEASLHVSAIHHTSARYQCNLCNFRWSSRNRFSSHFAKHHPNEDESIFELIQKSKVDKLAEDVPQQIPEPPTPPVEAPAFDSAPLWRRDSARVRHLRGILFEENGLKPKEMENSDVDMEESASVRLKRPFSSTTNEDMQYSKRGRKDDASLMCARCLQKFPIMQVAEYKNHLFTHFSSDDTRFKCARCLKLFLTHEETVAHLQVSHQVSTPSDVIDTHSEGYIAMDITRQTLESGMPAEVSMQETPSSIDGALFPATRNQSVEKNIDNTLKRGMARLKNTSPNTNKRFSPRNSTSIISPGETSNAGSFGTTTGSPTLSPTGTLTATSGKTSSLPLIVNLSSPSKLEHTMKNTSPSLPIGIRPLKQRSVLKTAIPLPASPNLQEEQSGIESLFPSTPESNQHTDLAGTSKENPKCHQEKLWKVVDSDIEVDESALEEDIEEVEEGDSSSDESKKVNLEISSKPVEEQHNSQPHKGTADGIECKYKFSHSCKFVSKTKIEASYHEKRHWEVQPWKCGHCNYQAVKQSSIKMHSGKRHPGLNVNIITNELPAVPKIVSLVRFHHSPPSMATVRKRASADKGIPDIGKLAELANVEDLFKNVQVLRCGYCRLNEASLFRLFLHWQNSHKDNRVLCETAPDGSRQIVPFKFREVKLGSPEKETIAFRCGLCARTGTVNKLVEHYPSRHPGQKLKISELVHSRVQCSVCPRQFSSKTALRTHFLAFHPGESVSSIKITTKDAANDILDINMGCLYCLEPVKTALEMKDHHLNFHSHLHAKYIEIDNSELDLQKANAECSLVGVENAGQPEVSETNRPSVICGVGRLPQEEVSSVTQISEIHSVVKRAVAKKSTSKVGPPVVRAVARKSTGGKDRAKLFLSPSSTLFSSSSSDVESDDNSQAPEDAIDVNKICCPIMIGGVSMRVNVATLSKYSNIYPSIVLKRLDS